MTRRIRRLSIAGLAVLLAGAVGWWATRPAADPSTDGVGGERGAIDERRPELRGVEGAKADDAAERAEPAAPAAEAGVAADEARLTGRVRLPDGKAPKGGEVWLTIPDPEGRGSSRILGHVPLASDGTYRISARDLADGGATAARVAVVVDGFEARIRDVSLRAGRAEVVDLDPDADGMKVQVRVLDPEGKPVAGLTVRLTQAWPEDEVHLAELPLEHEMSQGPHSFARARTDAEGRFVLRSDLYAIAAFPDPGGLVPGVPRLRFVSESAEWFLERPFEVGRFPGQDVQLTARPTVVLTGRVTSTADGAPVATFEGHARWAGHTHYVAFSGSAGVLDLCWPRWWGPDEEGRIDLAVEAKDCAPAEVPVFFRRGERRAVAEVRLTPIGEEQNALLELEVVDWQGRPFDGPWWVRLVDPADDTKTLQDLGLVERVEAGLYRVAAAPPGRWTMLVSPNDSLGFLRWTRPVDLRPGTNRLRCEMPPHGTLVVRWPKDEDPEFVAVSPARGSGGSMAPARGDEFRSGTCAEGDWTVRLFGAGIHATGTGTVRAGEETVVEPKE